MQTILWRRLLRGPTRIPFPSRFYGSQALNTENTSRSSKFDKSMLKPALVVVLFGSMLTNVMEQERKNEEMENRYALKIQILRDMICRVEKNEKVDPDQELMLVNKLFQRFLKSEFVGLEEDASRVRDSVKPKENTIKRLNGMKASDDDMTSLRDLYEDIMKDVNNEELSLPAETVAAPKLPEMVPQITNSSSEPSSDSTILTDKAALAKEAEAEKERLKYKPETGTHVIVENAGDYSGSADDMKVSKFL
ncbi:LADA_0H20186g1_1 [Lachancea dasiensis]|uniref:LADA_0H20186g1_1 n=1 Tax=Lachancea dasiensis TaxID=1072105 RepID=A0A1G4K6P8_9SACH|nr:LADA_0H20186g1_1 [Lachancea dasiensis]